MDSTTVIRNLTHTQLLLTRHDGTVIFLSDRGSVTYPNLDLLAEPLDGLLDVQFTRVTSLEENQEFLKNTSNSHYMCVEGRIGETAIRATYLLPGGRVSVNYAGRVDLKVFIGKYEFLVSKPTLQSLDNPKLAVPLVVFREGPEADTFTVFTLSRVFGDGVATNNFEIRSNSTPLSISPSCMLSCKTLPRVSLCMTAKTSIVILSISFFLVVIVVCLFTGMYVMSKPARCEK